MTAKTHPGITKTSLPVITASMTDVRTGLNAADLRQAVIDHMSYTIGRLPAVATMHDYYQALALAVRDRMQQRWLATTQTYFDLDRKIACYLSAEFLMGPHLGNNLMNLGIEDVARVAMAGLGQDLDAVLACEEEPGLGNGGLGRLAACYQDDERIVELCQELAPGGWGILRGQLIASVAREPMARLRLAQAPMRIGAERGQHRVGRLAIRRCLRLGRHDAHSRARSNVETGARIHAA